jgi:hypothetical protein
VLAAGAGAARAAALPLSISGNKLFAGGQPVQLRGVDYSYFVGNCAYSDPEPPLAQTAANMKSWGVNAVRLAFDPFCWLGTADPIDGGTVEPANTAAYPTAAAYRAAILQRVRQWGAAGFWVDLDAYGTDYMPTKAYLQAWTGTASVPGVAATFATDKAVLFDPINEVAMYPGDGAGSSDNPSLSPWACWRSGCTITTMLQGRVAVPGMQAFVTAIRRAGASTQPITLGSLGYNSAYLSGSTDEWLAHLPSDPSRELMADTHRYDFDDVNDGGRSPGNGAGDASFDAFLTGTIASLAGQVPVVFGELGEVNCNTTQTNDYTANALSHIDSLNAARGLLVGALGYEWRAPGGGYGCPTGPYGSGGPLLLTNKTTGAPTKAEGLAFQNWMRSHAAGPLAPELGGVAAAPGSLGAW